MRRRRAGLPAARDRSERGAVAAVLAVALLGLMALTALAMDMSLLFNWRAKDQSAADHAALAAAGAYCKGAADPLAAAYDSALDNGYDNNGTTNTVLVADLGSGRFEVIVRNTFDAIFARVIQIGQLRASGKAVAECLTGTGYDYAMFAGSTTCEKAIDWPGSTTMATGVVHSNHDFYMGGSSNNINGDTSYVTTSFVNATNTLTPPPQQVGIRTYPVSFSIADYSSTAGEVAAMADAQGKYYKAADNEKIDIGWLKANTPFNETTGELAEGLYFTNADIDLSAGNLHGKVTFVTSGGKIMVSGSDQNLEPWDPSLLLAFSDLDTSCTDLAITFSGGNSSWTGILYAPSGLVEMPGSTNTSFSGTIVADTIRLNGSTMTMNPLLGCCPVNGVFLME